MFINEPLLSRPEEPPVVTDLSRMFWASAVLRVAVKKELFTLLDKRSLTTEEISSALNTDPLYTRRFLKACAVLGLLELDGDRYHNTVVGEKWLVKGKPEYQGNIVLHNTNLWMAWDGLEQALDAGAPVPQAQSIREREDVFWRQYMLSQHERALAGQASLLLQAVDLQGRKKLLDVGAGAGSYSIALCRRYPELEAVLVDQEVALPLARSLIAEEGLADRISTRAGDYKEIDYGRGFDAVLFSGVLCQESDEDCRLMLKKAYDCLRPGGVVIVQDLLYMNDAEQRDAALAFYDLYLILFYGRRGGVRTAEALGGLLAGAGFDNVRRQPFSGLFSVITAEK